MPTMNAVAIDEYGSADVLKYRTVERPTPAPDELLVKSHASSVNPVDCNVRRGDVKMFVRLKLPKVLGIDFSGEVVEVGSKVTAFKPGDAVFGWTQLGALGAYAEYVAVKEPWARPKPASLSHLEAAALAGVSVTATQGLRNQAKLQSGQTLLLIGASGGVGTAALQIARALGATVTAVCGTSNVELVKSLGAERVIDYKQVDPLKDAERFDVVLDCVGQSSYWDCRGLLKPHGTHVVVPFSPKHGLNAVLAKLDPGHSSRWFFSDPNTGDLELVRQLVEQKKLKPIVTRTYRLADLASAHRESELGRTVGKIGVEIA